MGIYKEVQMTKPYAPKAVVGLFYLDIKAALLLIKMDFIESRHIFDTRKLDPLWVLKI